MTIESVYGTPLISMSYVVKVRKYFTRYILVGPYVDRQLVQIN